MDANQSLMTASRLEIRRTGVHQLTQTNLTSAMPKANNAPPQKLARKERCPRRRSSHRPYERIKRPVTRGDARRLASGVGPGWKIRVGQIRQEFRDDLDVQLLISVGYEHESALVPERVCRGRQPASCPLPSSRCFPEGSRSERTPPRSQLVNG